jgi:hypothetical protein
VLGILMSLMVLKIYDLCFLKIDFCTICYKDKQYIPKGLGNTNTYFENQRQNTHTFDFLQNFGRSIWPSLIVSVHFQSTTLPYMKINNEYIIWNKRNYIFKENERKNVNIGTNHVRFHSFMEKHYVTLQIFQREAVRSFFY